jgi:hypothetical protein
VDPKPAALACRELLVLLIYPCRHIRPMNPRGRGFVRQPPDIDIRARILLILQEVSHEPPAIHSDKLTITDRVVVASVDQITAIREPDPVLCCTSGEAAGELLKHGPRPRSRSVVQLYPGPLTRSIRNLMQRMRDLFDLGVGEVVLLSRLRDARCRPFAGSVPFAPSATSLDLSP